MNLKNSIHKILSEMIPQSTGLRRKLLVSHLAIAGIGILLLLVSLASNFLTGTAIRRLVWKSIPTSQVSLQAVSGLQQSLASLRGWVVLGDDIFKSERSEAWENKIKPSINELGNLESPKDRKRLNELKAVADKLENLQWWIEDVAQTPGNEPALLSFNEKIKPISEKIFNEVTEIIDSVKNEKSGLKNVVLIGSLADFRSMIDRGGAILKNYLESGNKADELLFLKYLEAADRELKELFQLDSLRGDLRDRLARIEWDFKDFNLHTFEAIKIRKGDEWNIAESRLRTLALPLETEVTGRLNQLSLMNERKMKSDALLVVRLGWAVCLIAGFLIIGMGVLAYYLSNRAAMRVTAPILAIAASAEELLKGSGIKESGVMEHVDRGELTQAFQSMQFALERSHKELTRSNKDLEQFAYVASHDLQEPLAKITTFSGFLKEKLRESQDEEVKVYLDRMESAAKRMRQLIKDLLEYSKIQTDPGEFPEVSLNETVQNVLSDLEIRIRETGAKVEVGNLPAVKAEPIQMQQLFQNLISNGLKYRKDQELPVVKISCSKTAGKIFFEFIIQDNGIGFDSSKTEEIFLPFRRLHGIGKYEGSGVGLSVCQKIVQRYGGSIRAESSPGAGSKFIFTLPFVEEDKRSDEVVEDLPLEAEQEKDNILDQVPKEMVPHPFIKEFAKEMAMNENLSVLMVEDNPDDALILDKLLTKCCKPDLQFVTHRAESMEEALRKLKAENYQLVLTDLTLPDSQGLETFTKIREIRPELPVVICSTIDDQKITLEAIRKGAQDFIIKGQVNQRDLERVIRFTLERRRMQEMKEQFVGMVIHDICNPLAAVQTCLKMLRQGDFGKLTQEQQRFVKLASENSGRIRLLVDSMMEVTKIELGKLSLDRKKVDIVDLVRRVSDGMQFVVQAKKLEFRVNLPSNPIEVWADVSKIEQVIMNLISNAVKYTSAGMVEVSLAKTSGKINCTVRDTGRGIDQKHFNSLFKTFQNMDHFGTAGEKGTGLGLAIVKGIITAHQGDIKVESELGKGSAFIFSLPG